MSSSSTPRGIPRCSQTRWDIILPVCSGSLHGWMCLEYFHRKTTSTPRSVWMTKLLIMSLRVKGPVCFNRSSCCMVKQHLNAPHTHLFNIGIVELGCRTISVTFRNWQSDIHTHFTQWMGSCEVVRRWATFFLFYYSIHNYFCHFSCVQMMATLWILSGRDSLKCMPLSPFMGDYCFSLWQQAFHCDFKCDHLEQLLTLFPSDMVSWHILQTSSFWALGKDILLKKSS